jgi:peroxiredoxin
MSLGVLLLVGLLLHRIYQHNPKFGSLGRYPKGIAKIEDFTLWDHRGESLRLYTHHDAKAIVLVSYGVGCPIAHHSLQTLYQLRQHFEKHNVEFYLLDASPQDDYEALQHEAKEFDISIPILRDDAQLVARSLSIHRTAEAIVIDPQNWTIVYRGAIDDRLGYETQKEKTTHPYLLQAIEALLAGRAILIPQTPVKGCLISYDQPKQDITYIKDVAPILRQRCAYCHHVKGMAPWAMTSYAKIKGWAPMIREVIRTKRMPPWRGDPHFGPYQDYNTMTIAEVQTLMHWIEAGMPRGEGSDPLTEHRVPQQPRWPWGEPDIILKIPEHQISASGIVPNLYDFLEFSPGKRLWLKAVYLRSDHPGMLHHSYVFEITVRNNNVIVPTAKEFYDRWFALFAAGTTPFAYPEGTGKLLDPESRFGIERHYITTGKSRIDQPELGLYLLKDPPVHPLITGAAVNTNFVIPAGVKKHIITAEYTFDEDVYFYELGPHSHYRCRHIQCDLHFPNGNVERILSIPDWDFNWQIMYRLAQAKFVPQGTQLVCTGTFDNSTRNPANPNPKVDVRLGEQSENEMYNIYFSYRYVHSQKDKIYQWSTTQRPFLKTVPWQTLQKYKTLSVQQLKDFIKDQQ